MPWRRARLLLVVLRLAGAVRRLLVCSAHAAHGAWEGPWVRLQRLLAQVCGAQQRLVQLHSRDASMF